MFKNSLLSAGISDHFGPNHNTLPKSGGNYTKNHTQPQANAPHIHNRVTTGQSIAQTDYATESKEAAQIASPPDTASAVESRTGTRQCNAVNQSFLILTRKKKLLGDPSLGVALIFTLPSTGLSNSTSTLSGENPPECNPADPSTQNSVFRSSSKA